MRRIKSNNQKILKFSGDDKIRKDVINKVFDNDVKKNEHSEKDETYKNISINRFFKVLKHNKRELQSNKQILWKKVLITL